MIISTIPSSKSIEPALPPTFQTPAEMKMQTTSGAVDDTRSITAKINFSSVTPRRLQAYLDDMLTCGRMDALDAGILGGALLNDEWKSAPDVPLDLRSRLEGAKEFHSTRGDPLLAVWYSGLLDRMKTMEAMSVNVSVVA